MKPTGLKMLLAGGGALSSGVLAQTSGDLTVLAMNVAGLPEILQNNDVPGDKTTNSRTIGSYFAKFNYDIIHVQEVSFGLSYNVLYTPRTRTRTKKTAAADPSWDRTCA